LDSDTGAGSMWGPAVRTRCVSNRVTGLTEVTNNTYYFGAVGMPARRSCSTLRPTPWWTRSTSPPSCPQAFKRKPRRRHSQVRSLSILHHWN
jgi:hypothetical protein